MLVMSGMMFLMQLVMILVHFRLKADVPTLQNLDDL